MSSLNSNTVDDRARRFLRRDQAATYVTNRYGFPCSRQWLAKLAVVGGGPVFRKAGRYPIYLPDDLDRWAQARIGPAQRSTSDTARATCRCRPGLSDGNQASQSQPGENPPDLFGGRDFATAECQQGHRAPLAQVRAGSGRGAGQDDRARQRAARVPPATTARRRSSRAARACCSACAAVCRRSRPTARQTSFRGTSPSAGTANLRGVCPDCSALMYRRVNIGRLDSVRGNLEIAFPDALSRLRGIPSPSLNDDFQQGSTQA